MLFYFRFPLAIVAFYLTFSDQHRIILFHISSGDQVAILKSSFQIVSFIGEVFIEIATTFDCEIIIAVTG